MQAPYYSMRMNYQALAGCTSYPCSRSNLYGMEPSSVTLASEADRNALMESILPLAAAEYNLDEQLMQVSQHSWWKHTATTPTTPITADKCRAQASKPLPS